MKALLALVAALLAAGLVSAYYLKSKHLAQSQKELVVAREQADKKAAEARAAQEEKSRVEEQKTKLMHLADEMGTQLQAQRQTNKQAAVVDVTGTQPEGASTVTSTGGGAKGGLGDLVAKMMNDPETRKFIREQQKTMVDQLYSPLMKQLALTPEQSDKFRELMLDTMMKGAEKVSPLFGADPAARKQAMEQVAADQKQVQQEIKDLLGEDGYARYQDYNQTAQERAQLNMFRQQNATGEQAISDAQAEQLLEVMKEEKKIAMEQAGQPTATATPDAGAMEAALSEQGSSKILTALEQANARTYERATSMLTPEQLGAFGRFQTNQYQMMRMGLTMARKLMSGDSPAPQQPATGER